MKTTHMIIAGVSAIAIASASFWGGMTYAAGSSPQRGQFAGAGQYASRQGGGFRSSANGAVFGTVVSKDANSITVQLGGPNASSTNGTDTGSKIILIDSKTQVGKFVMGNLNDLSTGELVLVAGTPNSDGSVTAQMIQIRPAGSTALFRRGQ